MNQFMYRYFFLSQELREDNAILIDTKNMLQEELDNCHRRVESVISLENDLGKFREQVAEMVKVNTSVAVSEK